MESCESISKYNIDALRELNKRKLQFNTLNKDFFEHYDVSSFTFGLIIKRKAFIVKDSSDYKGFIWSYSKSKGHQFIDSLYVSKDDYDSLKILISALKHNSYYYYCINNNFNIKMLTQCGFQIVNGTLEMKYNIDNVIFNNVICNNYTAYSNNISFEIAEKGKSEDLRCRIQNSIFNNINRIPLSKDDIFMDEIQNYYFDEGAVFIKLKNIYIGYGQIIIDNGTPKIVNFGILEGYRGNGYSKILLSKLILILKENNYTSVIIRVKSNNSTAINLYESFGFNKDKETFTLKIDC